MMTNYFLKKYVSVALSIFSLEFILPSHFLGFPCIPHDESLKGMIN